MQIPKKRKKRFSVLNLVDLYMHLFIHSSDAKLLPYVTKIVGGIHSLVI